MEEELEEQYWHARTWEVIEEIANLQREGKITNLKYRLEKDSKEYVIRFIPTKEFDIYDERLFILHDHYPDEYENRRKWYTW